jgi:3-phenylpropionate/trans-cinnamate dioxygenase ferredoxin reductase component
MVHHSEFDVVIVGAGHGGAQAAIALRSSGFSGSIAIVGDESNLPYERPPLSKEYLSGEKPFDRLLIRPSSYWSEKNVTFVQGHRVSNVNPDDGFVTKTDGATISYRYLIWAAGGDARKLSCQGSDLKGVHSVRNRADVDAIIDALPDTHQIVIIGGGYIGLEAAAALSKLGKKIVLLEAMPRVLERVAGKELSQFFEQEHRAQGIDMRTDSKVSFLEGDESVTAVALESGEKLPADMVIVGIGIVPSVKPLLEAGAIGGNGVIVDAQCRTSFKNIFAIGDCAAHPNVFANNKIIRLESVQNANDMATVVAKTICGQDAAYNATPWFWSNQYDLKLQTVGLSTGYDQTILRGNPTSRSFTVIYLHRGKIIALDCVNNVRDYAQGRRLVELGSEVDPEQLSDYSRPLKEWTTSQVS